MSVRAAAKTIWSVISVPFWVFGYLNVEKLIENKKLIESENWGMFLTNYLGGPSSEIVSVATSPELTIVSTGVVFFTLGLWADNILSRQKDGRRMVSLSHDCEKVVRLIEDQEQRIIGGLTVPLRAEMESLNEKIRGHGIPAPNLDGHDNSLRLMVAYKIYLQSLVPLMRDGHLRKARVMGKQSERIMTEFLDQEKPAIGG